MKNQNFLTFIKTTIVAVALIFTLSYCSEEELLTQTATSAENLTIGTTADDSCLNCAYIVPANISLVDGKVLGIKPGSVIGLNAAFKYKNLLFRNIKGTAEMPVIIKSFGGTVNVNGTGLSYGIKTENSEYFRITGGNVSKTYGIRITGGQLGITLDKFSTNFEVDHLEIMNVGFAGVMAKTDPNCDNATLRGNFTMRDISIHDNYVHETGGEGFYVGNSFFEKGMNTACGLRLPHEIHNVKIFNNIVKNSGWEAIQLGCATKGAKVYSNTVENYGTANRHSQNNGVQIGAGTGGLFYSNYIKKGTGNGLIVMGLGDNVIHNNVIAEAGAAGVFCDERYTPGPGFKFINNNIINPKGDGIRIYADLVPMNVIVNNIIVNPGSYATYTYPRTGDDAFVYKLSKNVKIDMTNNYFTRNIDDVKFANCDASNFRLTFNSPVVDKGKSISTYNINKDFYKQTRLKGAAYDIGASEY